jgi:hypothetical protein
MAVVKDLGFLSLKGFPMHFEMVIIFVLSFAVRAPARMEERPA